MSIFTNIYIKPKRMQQYNVIKLDFISINLLIMTFDNLNLHVLNFKFCNDKI